DGWLQDGEMLPSRKRPINAGDIMILVRKRSQFADEMVRRLKARNIPVAGSDRMELTEQLGVMDLIAAARFALLPDDDLNTAIVLKGPFADLSEDQLFDLSWNRNGTIWQALTKNHPDSEACIALTELRSRADFMPPFEFFTTLLGADRGREKLVARLGQEANDPIDEFLNQAMNFEREHVASMEGFMGWIEAAQTQIKRDMEAGNDKVRVMTVHGSKGLEANIVILPDTCSAPDGRMSDKVLWGEDKTLPLWPGIRENETEACSALRDDLKEAELEEYRRLLYVAMTRARDRLYITGWERKNPAKEAAHGRDEGSWYELVKPALEGMDGLEIQDEILQFSTPQRDAPVTGDEASIQILPLPISEQPDWLRGAPPIEPEPSLPLSPSKPTGEEPTVSSPFEGEDTSRYRRGSLIHRLLQSLPDLPAGERAQAARRWLEKTASDLEVDILEDIATETLNIVQHSDFADIFGENSLPEVAIAGTIMTDAGPRTIAGQVDRLCIGEDTITIVDYKTNRPPPKDEKDVPEIYFRQMALYKSALEHIYEKHQIRCMLVWTHAPRVMVLDTDKLQTHTP
ncbi:MAG: double-strand break repair helicase AddA, partial [Rhodospirillales bacterium]|nr:double-strand break repair helicase AddA [Rhodospirillales bacterium]